MTGKERRKTIQQMVTAKGSLSARELAELFCVSRMTIHRDFRILEDAGKIKRLHGGAVNVHSRLATTQGLCKACNKPILTHQSYLQLHSDGSRDIFCCAYCGLKAHLQQTSPVIYYATDMISGKILPAEDAYFLIRSSATPCCQTSILTFATETEVITFHSSFGGVLGRLNEAHDFLRTEQTLKTS